MRRANALTVDINLVYARILENGPLEQEPAIALSHDAHHRSQPVTASMEGGS